MAELTIRWDEDRRTIVVRLESDEDYLPSEHERLHRRLVERLLGIDVDAAADGARLKIERERPAVEPAVG